MAWEAGKPVVTFPIPGVPGATGAATLDAKYMTEKVVVTKGSTTTEFTYSDYKDWNNPLNKIEVFYAGKMVERRNGAVVRDLTTDVTETGNVYVVAPVPASVKKAIAVPGSFPRACSRSRSLRQQVGAHAAAGRASGPDGQLALHRLDWELHDGRRAPMRSDAGEGLQPERSIRPKISSSTRPRGSATNRPLYKPEHWDKVQQLDMWTNKYDPVMTCQPLGVPRQGPPRRIYQTDNDVIFLYRGGDAGGGYGEYRIIPTDGRKHAQDAEFDTTYLGDTVGRWEGDTLVLDSIAFIDTTWIGRGGFFHSDPCVSSRSSRVRAMRSCTTSRWRTRGAGGAVGVPDANAAAQPESRRGPHARARQLRDELETEAAASQIRH